MTRYGRQLWATSLAGLALGIGMGDPWSWRVVICAVLVSLVISFVMYDGEAEL